MTQEGIPRFALMYFLSTFYPNSLSFLLVHVYLLGYLYLLCLITLMIPFFPFLFAIQCFGRLDVMATEPGKVPTKMFHPDFFSYLFLLHASVSDCLNTLDVLSPLPTTTVPTHLPTYPAP